MNAQVQPAIELPSTIVRDLCEALQSRERCGSLKYGATLDRPDLTAEQWSEHLEQELLDAAGYNRAFRSELQALREQLAESQREAARLRIEIRTLELSAEVLREDNRKLQDQLQEARDEAERQHLAAMEQHEAATLKHQLLEDWLQLGRAVAARGLPDTQPLWPNPWHQECAVVGWALDTIIRAAERTCAAAEHDSSHAQLLAVEATERQVPDTQLRIPIYLKAEPPPAASEVIKVYAVGSAAIEQILHEEIMQRCATVRIDERDAFQLTPASLADAASIVAERLMDLMAATTPDEGVNRPLSIAREH